LRGPGRQTKLWTVAAGSLGEGEAGQVAGLAGRLDDELVVGLVGRGNPSGDA
jgi:hypothetical protein